MLVHKSAHLLFLIHQAITNLFRWLAYKVRHSSFGRWFKNIRESRKAKQEAERLEKLAAKGGAVRDESHCSLEESQEQLVVSFDGYFDEGEPSNPRKSEGKGKPKGKGKSNGGGLKVMVKRKSAGKRKGKSNGGN